MSEIMLSKYFSHREMRCKCCGKVLVEPGLMRGLDAMREQHGLPIRVTSGYRCKPHNDMIGGSSNSMHVRGRAADIVIPGLSVLKMYILATTIMQFGNGGIGIYPENGFIHVDTGSRRRWGRVGGKYCSLWDAVLEAR